jgi:hypothetical protein
MMKDQQLSNEAVKAEQAERQCHARAILTDNQARAIFQCKPLSVATDRHKAGYLARIYGISAKTVRDIWVGRTWYWATYSLDMTKPISKERLQKKLGRPRGAKDSKPRTRKLYPEPEEIEKSISEPCRSIQKVGAVEPCVTSRICPADRTPADRSSIEQLSIRSESTGLADSDVPTPNANTKIVPDQTWHHDEVLLRAAGPADFIDPFHHDWHFWPKEDTPC